MIILFFLSCLVNRHTLTGVIDYVGEDKKNCTIILENSDMIIVNSKVCKNVNEGDSVYFYLRKK